MLKMVGKLYIILATILFSICLILLLGNAIQFKPTMSANVIFSIITVNVALFLIFFGSIPMLLAIFTPGKHIRKKIEDIIVCHNGSIIMAWYAIVACGCIISMVYDFNNFAATGDNLIWTIFGNGSPFAN